MEKRAANPGGIFAKPRNSEPMEGGVGCLGQSRNITPRAIVGKRSAANMNFLLRLGTLLCIEVSGLIGLRSGHLVTGFKTLQPCGVSATSICCCEKPPS